MPLASGLSIKKLKFKLNGCLDVGFFENSTSD